MLLISFFACTKNKDKDIIGVYKMDKYVLLNKSIDIKDYQYLELNPDYTFNLYYSKTDTISQIQGRWKLLRKLKDDGLLLHFEYGKKVIEGNLKGNVFYFINPNDFHKGKYQSVLYVKTWK